VVAELSPHYGEDCPVAVVWRASWPDQRIVRATLATLESAVDGSMERTALILVGRAIGMRISPKASFTPPITTGAIARPAPPRFPEER
jgi:precorrin-4/cobalt-precorrin-4 C11-methyltransferase